MKIENTDTLGSDLLQALPEDDELVTQHQYNELTGQICQALNEVDDCVDTLEWFVSVREQAEQRNLNDPAVLDVLNRDNQLAELLGFYELPQITRDNVEEISQEALEETEVDTTVVKVFKKILKGLKWLWDLLKKFINLFKKTTTKQLKVLNNLKTRVANRPPEEEKFNQTVYTLPQNLMAEALNEIQKNVVTVQEVIDTQDVDEIEKYQERNQMIRDYLDQRQTQPIREHGYNAQKLQGILGQAITVMEDMKRVEAAAKDMEKSISKRYRAASKLGAQTLTREQVREMREQKELERARILAIIEQPKLTTKLTKTLIEVGQTLYPDVDTSM